MKPALSTATAFLVGVALMLNAAPGAAAKPLPPKQGKKQVVPVRPPGQFPGWDFPPYRPNGATGPRSGRGLSALLAHSYTIPPHLVTGRCVARFGALAETQSCVKCHLGGFGDPSRGRTGRFGAGELNALPGFGSGPWQDLVGELLAGEGHFGALRDQHLRLNGLDPEVMSILMNSVRPRGGLSGRGAALVQGDLGPWGINPLMPLGRFQQQFDPFGDVFGGVGALDTLLARPSLSFSSPYPMLRNPLFGPTYIEGFDFPSLGGLSGFGGFPGGLSGFYGQPMMSLPGFGSPFGSPLHRGGIDMWGPGAYRPRPNVRGPSPTEQADALTKFEKSLAGVETLARVGAWGQLRDALNKAGAMSGLPEGATVPLKAVQSEAARLDELLRLRAAITTEWKSAPDAAATAAHVESFRAATGDEQLAEHLTRLLVVKALWEGHPGAAERLARAEAPSLDAELESLRRPRLTDPAKAPPISTDEERVAACHQAVRDLLAGIDAHLDSGRYTVGVHLRDVRAIRTNATNAAKDLRNGTGTQSDGSFEKVVEAVGKQLGRTPTEVDRAVLRKMHAAKKTVDEMVEALR